MRYVDSIKAGIQETGVEVASMVDNMARFGVAADELAEIPEGFFEGIDLKRLNCAYLPPEFGGQQIAQSGVTRCVLGEMLGHADPSLTIALPGPGLALSPLLSLGTAEQQHEFFGRFDSPEPVWGAFAITEPGGGSDATNLETRAWKESAGYRLVGEKCLIGNGGRASFIVVYAVTDPDRGLFGIQPFVVDRNTPGLIIDDSSPMLGLRAVRVAHLRFDDCLVSEDRLLGPASGRSSARAFLSAQRNWEYWRPVLSGLMLGGLERLLDDLERLAAEVTNSRFRQTTASLVDRVRPQTVSVRLLAHHAAALFDAGEDSSVTSSMAKAAAAKLARSTIAEAFAAVITAKLESTDISRDIERWTRDFQAFELLEGTTEVHQLMITRGWSALSRRRKAGGARHAASAG